MAKQVKTLNKDRQGDEGGGENKPVDPKKGNKGVEWPAKYKQKICMQTSKQGR